MVVRFKAQEDKRIQSLEKAAEYLDQALSLIEEARYTLSAGFRYYAKTEPERYLADAWTSIALTSYGALGEMERAIKEYLFSLKYGRS